MQRPEHGRLAKHYEPNVFSMETRVQDLLERKESSGQACCDELDGVEGHVRQRLREVLQRHYPQFIDIHAGVEQATQRLLKVREEAAALRSTLQQIADLPLEELDDVLRKGHADPLDMHSYAPGMCNGNGSTEAPFTESDFETLRDDIELAVFEHDYDKAVSLLAMDIERVESSPPHAVELSLRRQLGSLEEDLVASILSALHNTPASSRYLLRLLIKLNHEQVAFNFFFSHRSEWVRREVKRIRFVGDVIMYAKTAANAFFHGVAATYDEFLQLSGKKQKSAAIRWIANEITEFSTIINKQILALEVFLDIFKVMGEVFKACRDRTEHLGLSLLPHVRQCFSGNATHVLNREAPAMSSICLNDLADDDFSFSDSDEALIDALHFPPLFSRSAKGVRMCVALSKSCYTLLHQVTLMVAAVRAACVHPVDSQSRNHDRPWLALVDPVDRHCNDLIRDYVKTAFKLPLEHQMSDIQSLFLLHNVSFIVSRLIHRVSTVLKETFYQERMTALDHLIDQSKSTPTKLLEAIARQWCAQHVQVDPISPKALRRKHALLPFAEAMVLKLAALRKDVLAVFRDPVEAVEVMKGYVNVFVPAVLSSEAIRGTTPEQRPVVVANLLLLKHALHLFRSKNLWGDFDAKYQPTDADHDALSQLLESIPDNLHFAMQELAKDASQPAIV